MGALMVFGTLSQLLGVSDGPVDLDAGAVTGLVAMTYGSWLVVGVALLAATLQAHDDRGPGAPNRAVGTRVLRRAA